MKLPAVLLFGAPGAGKGTQGKILGSIPGFYHFSCGDVFRHLTPNSELGRIFLDYSSRGQLVPDEPTIRLWRQNIEAATHEGSFDPQNDTLVLDGIPRNPRQAEMLKDVLDVRVLLYFTCADTGKMVNRLQRRALRENRLDDANTEIIRKRLDIFETESKPVVDYYGPDLLRTIDSTQNPMKVLRDILNVLDPMLG